jgi:heptosyltransferase-2
MERILVLRGGALGDFIVTLPALAQLRERWPQARIELAGNASAGQLAASRGVVDVVHSQHEARWAGLHGDAPLPSGFAYWLSGFDLVVSYWPDPGGELARRFPLHAGQRFVSAAALPARAPAAAHYCEPLRGLGIEPREYFFRLAPLSPRPPRSSAAVGNVPPRTQRAETSDYIAIHPGSGSPRKNWPAENWRRLIAHLPPPVSLILGEAEIEPLGTRPPSVPVLAPGGGWADLPPRRAGERQPCMLINQPLETLVDHLSQCRLFLGHDSGISHLAAACGAQCVLLFGPTEPTLWAPPAPGVRVLRCGSNPASIPLDAVLHAVDEALAGQR